MTASMNSSVYAPSYSHSGIGSVTGRNFIKIHIKASRFERAGLALLTGFAPDELAHVGVVRVEDHHLRQRRVLANTRLDRPSRCIGATHED